MTSPPPPSPLTTHPPHPPQVSVPPSEGDIFSEEQLLDRLSSLVANCLLITRWLFKLPNHVQGSGFGVCVCVRVRVRVWVRVRVRVCVWVHVCVCVYSVGVTCIYYLSCGLSLSPCPAAYCDVTTHLKCHSWVQSESQRYGQKWSKKWAQVSTSLL